MICQIILIIFVSHLCKTDDLSNKFNVVIFLAGTEIGEKYEQTAGIKYLNFQEKIRVKHCIQENEDITKFESNGNDCPELLKIGLVSLISYCKNVLGMTTAIASLSNDSFSNGLRFKKSLEDLEVRYHHPKFHGRTRHNRPLYITKPEHTEIFKIRAKRENCEQTTFRIMEETTTPKWDIFGIMATIKLTFFGNLFENEENRPVISESTQQIGHVTETTLFDLVKETLMNVQEGCQGGFLIIILGGNLAEICDPYSTLIQSVKHVVENTDEQNTLIMVTGACPPCKVTDNPIVPYIPVFIKSPVKGNCELDLTSQLYDVPYAIKNMLADMNMVGNYFDNMKIRRKRGVINGALTVVSSLIFNIFIIFFRMSF